MAALNMERAAGSGYTQHQATWTVFVIGVVLNDLAARDCLPQLGDRDSPLNALIECVLRKLERPACDLRSNSIGQVHVMNRIKTESSRELTFWVWVCGLMVWLPAYALPRRAAARRPRALALPAGLDLADRLRHSGGSDRDAAASDEHSLPPDRVNRPSSSWLLHATRRAIPIPLAGLHRMAPAKCLGIGQIAPGSRDPACLDSVPNCK
jgi:hypothetical protein